MHVAPVEAVRQPRHLLLGWVKIVQSLAELGIAVRLVDMPAQDLADLDTMAGVLFVRADAEPVHQVWVLQQAWNAATIGPHASSAGKNRPLLRLVPVPRIAVDRLA